jgi:hypothetical protein
MIDDAGNHEREDLEKLSYILGFLLRMAPDVYSEVSVYSSV